MVLLYVQVRSDALIHAQLSYEFFLRALDTVQSTIKNVVTVMSFCSR